MKPSITRIPLLLAGAMLAAPCHAAEAPRQVFADDFARADTAASEKIEAAVGPGWFNGGTASPYLLKTGNLYPMPAPGALPLLIHGGIGTSSEGFEISSTFLVAGGGIEIVEEEFAGLVFNYQNPENHYVFAMNGFGRASLFAVRDGKAGKPFFTAKFKAVPADVYRLSAASTQPGVFEIRIENAKSRQPLLSARVADPGPGLGGGLGGIYGNSILLPTLDFRLESAPPADPAALAQIVEALKRHSANPPAPRDWSKEEVPAINTKPGPEYAYDQYDFGMGLGIAMTPGGRIWALMNPGDDGPTGFLVAATSDDRGETWSRQPRLVIDNHRTDNGFPFARANECGNFWTDPRGRLWLFFNQAVNYYNRRFSTWASVCENPDSDQPVWSVPVRIGDGLVFNKPTIPANGEWLLPVAIHHFVVNRFQPLAPLANVHVSTDEGKTWQLRGGVTVPDPNCHEHMITELRDGRLRMSIRNAKGMVFSDSTDHGRTWSAPQADKSIVNEVAHHFLRRLASGNLLFVKNGSTVDSFKGGRADLTAFLSKDDGATWEGGLLLDGRVRSSHPDGFQAADGMIYLTTDNGRGDNGEVLLHRFREEDVLSGKFESKDARRAMLIFKPDPAKIKARREAEARGEVLRKH
jgi:hypothetical protein